VKIYGFTDTSFRLNVPRDPITLEVERGRVVGALNSTGELDQVLSIIEQTRGSTGSRARLRMNRGFSRDRRVADVGASSGYVGPPFARVPARRLQEAASQSSRGPLPRDSFVVTDRVLLDDEVVYSEGAWHVSDVA